MTKKITSFLFFIFCSLFCMFVSSHEVIMHDRKNNHGNEQIDIEPPYVTYDDQLNELMVNFGSTGSIDLEYTDPTGTPYYYVQGETHVAYTVAVYTGLPTGYYTITIHSIYGYTYTGNFTVD